MAKTSSQKLEILDWGLLGYEQALKRQKHLAQERIANAAPDKLVIVEHPSVVTLGRSGSAKDLCMPEKFFKEKGVDIFHADRGGKATFHGPGQLVVYPIIKLKNKDLHWYVEKLLTIIANILKTYSLEPEFKHSNPGIWVNGKKIASIGISVKNWVTSHGIALNVNPNLTAFQWIIPCGHPDEIITSMKQELQRPLELSRIKEKFINEFCKSFKYPLPEKIKKPQWLKLQPPKTDRVMQMEQMMADQRLETVCQSANCPNMGECFSQGTATFMIMGSKCTRNCRFCAVDHGKPLPLDDIEPLRIVETVKKLGLKYVVITSVTRDDLEDGGATHFKNTIQAIRQKISDIKVEILIPDFQGSDNALKKVFAARPDMFNHNIETVPRLYPKIRPKAQFEQSLNILEKASGCGLNVKTGMMLGLGEKNEEIKDTLIQLRKTGCKFLTLGQYLAPSKDHTPVDRYVSPSEFDQWAKTAKTLGFKKVASGPLVRSSYHAQKMGTTIDL